MEVKPEAIIIVIISIITTIAIITATVITDDPHYTTRSLPSYAVCPSPHLYRLGQKSWDTPERSCIESSVSRGRDGGGFGTASTRRVAGFPDQTCPRLLSQSLPSWLAISDTQ